MLYILAMATPMLAVFIMLVILSPNWRIPVAVMVVGFSIIVAGWLFIPRPPVSQRTLGTSVSIMILWGLAIAFALASAVTSVVLIAGRKK